LSTTLIERAAYWRHSAALIRYSLQELTSFPVAGCLVGRIGVRDCNYQKPAGLLRSPRRYATVGGWSAVTAALHRYSPMHVGNDNRNGGTTFDIPCLPPGAGRQPATTGTDGRSHFAGFLLRHQRIGTRGHLTCSRRLAPQWQPAMAGGPWLREIKGGGAGSGMGVLGSFGGGLEFAEARSEPAPPPHRNRAASHGRAARTPLIV
jgi:hypothetical protein